MLTLSCLASAVLHVPLYFGVRWVAETYMSSEIRRERPVSVVRLSQQAWDASMAQAKSAPRRFPVAPGAPSGITPAPTTKKKVVPPKPEKKPADDKLDGQIVEVPATADDSPNPEAKYLSKQNSHVDKESIARIEDRDPTKRRVTNKLQEKDVSPARPEPGSLPTKGLTVEGTGDRGDQPGDGTNVAPSVQKKKTVIKVPKVSPQDSVKLKLTELPGQGLSLPNRPGTEAIKGAGDELQLQLGEDLFSPSPSAGGQRGSKDAQAGLPSLAALKPTVGTLARISGSPSRDFVEGVPEGDGTFLNTKEFKYATFFFRVRDSVATHWDGLVSNEYRRRDPTGNIYGVRDRATLLSIELGLDGRLKGVQVASSSGVDFLDSVAVEAFRMAEPFPNPPVGIADADGSIRFTFQFRLVHSRGPFSAFR